MGRWMVGLLLLSCLAGCVKKTLPPPDPDEVDLVSLEDAPPMWKGTAQVRPASPGETLYYRYKMVQRAMEPEDWNPFLAYHLGRELGRRAVDVRRGPWLTIGLESFSAGNVALGEGKRVELVVSVRSATGFSKLYTGTANNLFSLRGTIEDAVTELMKEILGDQELRHSLLRVGKYSNPR